MRPERRSIYGGVALVASAALAACSTSTPASPTTPPTPEPRIASAGPTSADQRAALADGHITRSEYEHAIDATRDCIETDGLTVTPLELDELGFLHYVIHAPDLPPLEAETIIDTCEHTHGAAVQAAYVNQELDAGP